MPQPSTEIIYKCEICGHTMALPPDEPVPECCGQPMTEGNQIDEP